MKKILNLMFSAFALLLIVACGDDDNALVGNDPDTGTTPIVLGIPEISESLLNSIGADGGIPFNVNSPALTFTSEQNVFTPCVLGIDYRIDTSVVPSGPTARFPLFQGLETLPNGQQREAYYIITDASDSDVAREMGIVFAPRMANAIGSGGEQNSQWTEDGRLIFEGSVDFSPLRSLVASEPSDDGLLFGFPPAEVSPGAIADENWSSFVVLAGTDIVINVQLMANSTGIHDRIPHPDGNNLAQQDDLNNPNLSINQASVVLQLLDGWNGGRRYYFHFVTDISAQEPAAIELGVYAPKLNNLPAFGEFPGGSMLPFSPTANGRTTDTGDGRGVQGLNTTSLSERQVQGPSNTFPIGPSSTAFSPMWDAHITEFTVPESERPILTSFAQINQLLEDGILINFRNNGNPEPLDNAFSTLLTATRAIINCPVITQPDESVIGSQIGFPRN